MKVGVLTGGGDAPGLNAAIRAITRKSLSLGWDVLGIRRGWLGLIELETMPLDRDAVRGILPQGGTILGTSRTNPYQRPDGSRLVTGNLRKVGIDALIPIGGEDTLGVALKFSQEGVKLVAVPKTIDNDLSGTEYCVGFDTAVNEVVRALDRLHPTAAAHHRVMIVEVMGRDAGWVATLGGLAGGADVILAPGLPFTIEEVCARLRHRHQEGNRQFSILVVAEGATPPDLDTPIIQESSVDEFGHARLGGIGHLLAPQIEARTGYETRVTVLGHT
ncbi:MAG: ATP-dependent 6-phosphofructokinase, partial [Chloroflexi bacterium]|nr:ATP-dependent 6-phosphofructokinase [Chloroflexota bacterium]